VADTDDTNFGGSDDDKFGETDDGHVVEHDDPELTTDITSSDDNV
jgi:hypothetical protein